MKFLLMAILAILLCGTAEAGKYREAARKAQAASPQMYTAEQVEEIKFIIEQHKYIESRKRK